MNNQKAMPGRGADSTGRELDGPGPEPDGPDGPQDAHEAALTQELLRLQERHREGGIDPDLTAGGGGGQTESALPVD